MPVPNRPDPEQQFRARLESSDSYGCKYHATVYYKTDDRWVRVDENDFVTKRGALRWARRKARRHLKQEAQKSEEVYFNA